MDSPLNNISVLELGSMIAVPAATQLLASYGASVIKIEDTRYGEGLRFYGSTKNGMSGWYANANAGKRSIALDLKTEAGVQIVKSLVSRADVLLEGFRPGVMAGLGLGYEDLASLNPRLIYCSSSGFGAEGPYAEQPAYDPLIQALSGWAGIQEVDGQPTLVRAMVADKVGAYNNAQAIMAALIQRGGTGAGCYVQTNMLDANVAFVWPDVMMDHTLVDTGGVDHRENLLRSYRLYQAADGYVSVAIGTDRQWREFCFALGREDLAKDPRFETSAARGAHILQWYDAIDEVVNPFAVAEVVTRLVDAEVPVAPVLSPAEVFDDAHVRATGMVTTSEHPIVGRFRHPRPRAAQFGCKVTLSPAPSWGEHSREILAELGYSPTAISEMISSGCVRA